jgi:aminobenzoyl-glutamate transport protein
VSAAAPPAAAEPPQHTFVERIFDRIERLGNRMPHPVILFILLCGAVIVVSQLLYWVGWQATYEVVAPPPAPATQTYYGGSVEPTYVGPTEPEPASSYKVETQTAKVNGLLTGSGVRFLFTSFVSNFRNFAAVAIILVVMLGVGLAESVGLIAALIRKLVASSSPSILTSIIVLLGVLSSIASDAGYLVLIPLGAAAFKSVGRNPLAGIAAAFAGVAAGFGVNFLITPLDGVLTEITNDAAGHATSHHIDLAANLFFGIGSTIFITIVMTIITTKLVENRLGTWDPAEMGEGIQTADDDAPEISAEAESRGLRYAMWATLGVLLAIGLLTAIPGAPLRNPVTGAVIGDSPFMDSLIVIITLVFFAAGAAFGKGAGTLVNKEAAIESITKSWAGLASLLLLFLFIAQFIAYFNFSNMAQVAAVKLGDVLERINISAVWLLIGVIIITAIVNIIIPQAIGKWALLAPIFIPLFIRLNVAPQTVLAAYRVGDSPGNVLTPLMAYFPLIVIFTQRYKRDAGIGTVIALMLPYVVVLYIAWTLFFVAWYLIGIPLGPGSPVHV